MTDSTLMPESRRVKHQEGAAPFLEPGETVQLAVTCLPLPAYLYLLLALTIVSPIALLPYAIQKNATILLTDRNVYVMKNGFSSFKPKRVLFKGARGQTDAERAASGGSPFLRVAEYKIWLPLGAKVRRRADAIAANAAAAPPPAVAAAAEAPPDAV